MMLVITSISFQRRLETLRILPPSAQFYGVIYLEEPKKNHVSKITKFKNKLMSKLKDMKKVKT